MRLRTFNRISSRAQPRKCTQPTIGPGQPPQKLDRAESTSEPSGQLERHDEHGCHSTRRGSTEAAGGTATRASSTRSATPS
jgi:hypothetical protein